MMMPSRQREADTNCIRHNRIAISTRSSMMFLFLFSITTLQLVESFTLRNPTFARTSYHQTCASRNSRIVAFSTFGNFGDELLDPAAVESLTIPQLKQQLRLRGLKVSGKKNELVERLLSYSPVAVGSDDINDEVDDDGTSVPDLEDVLLEPDMLSELESKAAQPSKSKARKLAEERGKQLIDVSAYVDEGDGDKTVKSSIPLDGIEVEESNPPTNDPETWGAEAKIVDDYEGRAPVVDGLSRTIIEFKGSNQTSVEAFVVASRDALKPFLAGGKNRTTNAAEDRLREIQTKRELAAKRPVRFEDDEGLDEGDETGIYTNVLHRDESDWGRYTLTGAQLSALEVQGVILLSDVYGAFSEDIKVLAEKIAFECQPVVVMVPDLFRGNPWKEDPTTPGFNEEGQDYEEWRSMHSDLRVNVDIRAAAAVLREQYGVNSIVTWGTCYGGGRALEIAAGYLPNDSVYDVDGETIGPPLVEPEVAVAWYPTRYNAPQLFGAGNGGATTAEGKERKMAVMGVFAGNDKIPGATSDDASELKSLLEKDERVKDHMVKVFPDQEHGFAHIGLGAGRTDSELDRFVDNEFGGTGRVSLDDGDAEVACLLSTAFMETYSRMFLPTVGPPISKDDLASEWKDDINMQDYKENGRDIRQEIEDSLDDFQDQPLGGKMIDPSNDSHRDELAELLRSMEPPDLDPEYKFEPDDTIEIMYAKLKASDENFQLF